MSQTGSKGKLKPLVNQNTNTVKTRTYKLGFRMHNVVLNFIFKQQIFTGL